MTTTDQAERVGSLYDDLESVASKCHRITGEYPIVVWADDGGSVRAISTERAPPVPPAWVAGTFDAASSPQDIHEDLNELLKQRVRSVILE